MAKFTSDNASWQIPDGQIFKTSADDSKIWISSGGKISTLDLNLAPPGVRILNNGPQGKDWFIDASGNIVGEANNQNRQDRWKQYLQTQGFDFNALPIFNIANVYQAMQEGMDQKDPQTLDLNGFVNLSKNLTTGGDVNIAGTGPTQAFTTPSGAVVQAPGPTTTPPPSGTGSAGALPLAPTGTDLAAPISGIQPPSVYLEPGSTNTAAVKQLQDYLVSKGFMTQAQVDTGYGTYGPRTTAAVAALQKSLGVDNSTGVGYFGPRTIAAINGSGGGGTTGVGTGASGGISGGAGSSTSPATVHPDLLTILDNPNLTADQRASLQAMYNASASGDTAQMDKLIAAFNAASQYSDPYFKAQIRLATDALDRELSGKTGDLEFAIKQKEAARDELRANTAASKDKLSFDHAQELQQLATKYETDLNTTRDNLAASGFTSSSKRARAEDILSTNNSGLVESSNKTFGYQTGNLDRTLASGESSTAMEIANLQRLTEAGKLDLLRQGEASVGTDNLTALGYTGLLGGIGGDIPQKQVQDALSFSNSFVT